ncbi:MULTISPECIES: NAD(P)-dependent oxidoreductase [Hyphomonas]|uniref:Epimerase n=1 Tax=Hyphomonas adhaerens TaxID=81029 RepID=A0A3B9GYB5_9PROT|nr:MULTISPECIES: SDR family oxidoreductase [Hyphomonas]MBB39800.1 epimerase [Hyphomonas sp.]HAE27378.1 epimerase [Hyphomonas adhaerens]|tara:strand:- start:1120 stop:1776 length:657 start_codon:yes stop_codon:yes gene_type:complete
MRIAVFGSTGGVGRHFVSQALEKGMAVTALVRSPGNLAGLSEGLTQVTGDVTNEEAVHHTVAGADAVVCALGAPLLDKSGIRATGTASIIRAMKAARVNRLICLSSIGAGDSYPLIPALYKYFLGPLMMERMFADHEAQEAEIAASGLDWIIARPGPYRDGDRTGTYAHGVTADVPDRKLKFHINRADVADFLIRQLSDNTYLHKPAWLTSCLAHQTL